MANNRVIPPNAGKGRGKGNKNKLTLQVKEMIEGALEDAGGREYLLRQAKENPVAFMGLVGKIIPKDLKIEADINAHIKNASIEELQSQLEANQAIIASFVVNNQQ